MCVQSYRAISIVDPLPVPSDRSAHLALYIVHQQKYPRHHISHEWPSINFTEEHSSAFNGLLGSQSVSARDRHDFMHLTSHGNVDTVDVRWVSHKWRAGKMQRYTTAWLGSARHGTARLGTARLGTARHGTAWLGSARHGTAWHGTARHGTARHGSAFSSSQRLQTSRRRRSSTCLLSEADWSAFHARTESSARQKERKNIYTSTLRNTDVWRKEMWKHTATKNIFSERKMTRKKGISHSSSRERSRGQNENSDRESEAEREVTVLKYTAGL